MERGGSSSLTLAGPFPRGLFAVAPLSLRPIVSSRRVVRLDSSLLRARAASPRSKCLGDAPLQHEPQPPTRLDGKRATPAHPSPGSSSLPPSAAPPSAPRVWRTPRRTRQWRRPTYTKRPPLDDPNRPGQWGPPVHSRHMFRPVSTVSGSDTSSSSKRASSARTWSSGPYPEGGRGERPNPRRSGTTRRCRRARVA